MADVELLPLHLLEAFSQALKGERGELDAWLEVNNEADVRLHVDAYARARVAHATAAKDAEIEALRAEVARQERLKEKYILQGDGWEHKAHVSEARADRLVEALLEAYGQVRELCDCYGHAYPEASFARYDALLQEQEQNHE